MCICYYKYSGKMELHPPLNPRAAHGEKYMVRPTLPSDQQRDALLHVRITAIEKAKLEERAQAVGLSVSEFVRRRSLGTPLPPDAADRVVKDKLATSLLRIGVNLNQIAKHMNAGRHAPPELPALVDTINAHLKILTADE